MCKFCNLDSNLLLVVIFRLNSKVKELCDCYSASGGQGNQTALAGCHHMTLGHLDYGKTLVNASRFPYFLTMDILFSEF